MRVPRTVRTLASRYWVKLLVQNAIGLLPDRAGTRANLALARAVQGPMQERPTAGAFRIRRSLRNIRLMREHAGFDPDGARVLELGTGWRAADPALFHVLGARRVVTLDHRRWLERAAFAHSVAMLDGARGEVMAAAGGAAGAAGERLDRLLALVRSGAGLDEILARIGVRYLVHPRLEIGDLAAGGDRFDAFYTESVLQRLPRPVLDARLDEIAAGLLEPCAVCFHRTDQRDINTLEHVGNARGALDYLRHSDAVFDTVISGRFTSQNRHRESDFLRLLQRTGVSLRYVESRLVPGDVERVRQIPLAARFRGKDPEDVAVRCSLIVGVHRDPAPREPVRVRRVGTVAEVEA